MKKLIFILILILLPSLFYSLDLQSLSDEELLFIKNLNQKLIQTQQQLDTALHENLDLVSQYNMAVEYANNQTLTLSTLIEERDSIINQQQSTIQQLSALIENRHEFGDLGMYLNLGAGTSITGQVEGRVWVTNDLYLFLNAGAGYPYLWDRDRFIINGNAGLGYSIEE